MIINRVLIVLLGFASASVSTSIGAQTSQRGTSTQLKGNTEISAKSENMTAVASGENTEAKNRVGVVQGVQRGNTKINANATNVTTTVSGRNKKACTNIGSIVGDDCK